LVFQLYY